MQPELIRRILYAVLIATATAYCADPSAKDGITLDVKPIKLPVVSWEKLPVHITIKNASHLPADVYINFRIKGISQPTDQPSTLWGPIDVKADGTFEGNCDLARYVKFLGPGEFEILYQSSIARRAVGDQRSPMDRFWDMGQEYNTEAGKGGSFKVTINKEDPILKEEYPIALDLHPVKNTLPLGGTIPVILGVKNVSASAVDIGFDANVANAYIRFWIKGVPPKEICFPSISCAPITIKAGEECRKEIDLAKFVRFDQPGEFEIEYKGGIPYNLENDPTPVEQRVRKEVPISGCFRLKLDKPKG